MSDTPMGAARACPEIEWNGQTWKIGYPTGRAKDILKKLFIRQATDDVISLKNVLDGEQYAEMFESHRLALQSGKFEPFKPGWNAVMQSPNGGSLFLLSLLRLNHPNATLADANGITMDKGDELALIIDQVMPDFFSVLVADLKISPEKRQETLATLMQAWQTRLSSNTTSASA